MHCSYPELMALPVDLYDVLVEELNNPESHLVKVIGRFI